MIDFKKLTFYLEVFKGINLKDITRIFKSVDTVTLSANDIWIKPGDREKKVAYIKKGLMRVYCYNDNGEEVTTLLRWEDQFLTSYDNIIFDRSSRFYYQAIEPTTLLVMNYDLLQKIMDENPKFEKVRKYFMYKMLGESLSRIEDFTLLSAQQRYLKFIEEKPDIFNRVPNKYIATILGITPVSLSRIRKRMAKGK
jgi:CRP-like cAMP-binding protein